MNQDTSPDSDEGIRPEYDFANAVQGKHHEAYKRGTNVIFLDPDVAKVFKDSSAVNEALRLLLNLAKDQAHTGGSA